MANYIANDLNVVFQSENGILGSGFFFLKGGEDAELINACKHITIVIAKQILLYTQLFTILNSEGLTFSSFLKLLQKYS